MLSSLIKHEWKETWKLPAISAGFIVVLTLISVITFLNMSAPLGKDEFNMGAFIMLMVYCMAISCACVVVSIYLAVRFYRNLYTDEGYLMHTLPVTPRQLLLSKGAVGIFWLYLTNVVTLWAVMIILVVGTPVLVRVDGTFDFTGNIKNTLFGNLSLGAAIPMFLALLLVSSFYSAFQIYASISLGQLFGKHKVIGSVVCYIGITLLIQTVSSIAMLPFMTNMIVKQTTTGFQVSASFGPFILTVYMISGAVCLLFGIAFYALTEYVMKKQLNLD